MLIRTLIQRFRFMNAVGVDGADLGGGAAPAADTPSVAQPEAAPIADGPAAPTSEEAKPFAGLEAALDAVSNGSGQPRDALGRFAPADIAAAPATPTPTAAPVAAPTPTATPAPTAAPRPGEVDLTPPEGMTPRAQERWAQLTERAKQVPDLERRATEASTALESVRRLVTDSGLAPNEFGDLLQIGRLYKSSNPQEMQAAIQRLDALRADLGQRLGIEVPGIDPLAGHADLKQKVEGMLMTREDALEIARLRGSHQQAQAFGQEQRDLQQHQHAVQQASAQMDAALTAKAGTPGHESKVAFIKQYFANPQNLQAFVSTYQPQQWTAALTMMYDSFTPPVPTTAPVPSGPQPLRPGMARAGAPQRTGPVTAESAVEGAFDRLGF